MCEGEKRARSAQRTDSGQGRKEEPRQGGRPNQVQDKGDSSGEIAYQNKDIASKFFAERLRGKSFQVYGLRLPDVKAVLPTNIPAIKVNELRLDNLLGLEDGSVAVVDYESDYGEESKTKYLNYLTGVMNRYANEKVKCPELRMIVIYTGDIRRKRVRESLDVGAVRLKIEPAFLSEVDGDGIYRRLKGKVERGELLSDQEQMELIIFPLTYKKKEEKWKRIQEAVSLALEIRDQSQQVFVLAGLITFTDKLMDQELADKIGGMIRMTKVEMYFERLKEEAVKAERQKMEEAMEGERKRLEEAVEAERQKTEAERQKTEAERQKTKAERQRTKAERQKVKAVEKEKRQIEKSFQEIVIMSVKSGLISLAQAAEYPGLDMGEVVRLTQSSS